MHEVIQNRRRFRMHHLGLVDRHSQQLCAAHFFVIGSVTSFSNFAIQTTGKYICPENTTPQSNSYQTTTHDEYGNSQPATAYELQCVDVSGEVVKTDPVVYAFLRDGIFAVVGLIVALLISFALAAPAGALAAKLLNRNKTDQPSTHEPVW